jgi:heavy metal sensor kinase
VKNRSIGFRLAGWYFLVFAAGIFIFGVLAWFGMRASLYGAIDAGLRDRADSLADFLADIETLPGDRMQEELQEHALPGQGGNLFQVRGENGHWLFRSRALAATDVPLPIPSRMAGPESQDYLVENHRVRLYSTKVQIVSTPYSIEVAAVIDQAASALNSFRFVLLLVTPLLILASTGGAYWISRRALAPIDRITRTAQRISIENLAGRLDLPRNHDELWRLSQTLNEMLARLEASVIRMTQFTADAAHELRTPISLIRTTAEVAVRRTRTSDEYRQALAEILQEAERTSQVVETLMLLARVDSGKERLAVGTVDVTEILNWAAEAGEKLAHANGLEFSLRSEEPVAVLGDAHALQRAVLILLENAAKYTPSGGWIRLEGGCRGQYGLISVADSGIGITGEDLPHIFDRFWRADPARTRDDGGAGLGLSIANWIAAAQGGNIEVASEPGKGSVFTLVLRRA